VILVDYWVKGLVAERGQVPLPDHYCDDVILVDYFGQRRGRTGDQLA